MVGGGVAMGPRTRSHAHDLPKKIRKLGLKIALSSKASNGKLFVIKDAKLIDGKTSILAKNLKLMGLKSVLFIDGDNVDSNFRNAAANIVNVDVLPTIGANVYDIIRRDNLILTEEAVKKLEERLK
jgi:large subunit ribosomal protein L4